MHAEHRNIGALSKAHRMRGRLALCATAIAADFRVSLAASAAGARHVAVILGFAFTVIFASIASAQRPSAGPASGRTREIERLINALVSRNEAPKLVGENPLAYPVFSEQFDWTDQKRVQAAAWTIAQDDSNDLWGCLVDHISDKRYSGTCQTDENYPTNSEVGEICASFAYKKIVCAYLKHLKPAKTFYYGGPTSYAVADRSDNLIPDTIQRDLHYVKFLSSPGQIAAWYRARKGKPFYQLQIEVCEWAIKVVEGTRGVAERPREGFAAAVRKQIDSLKKSKRPVTDHSPWASPLSREDDWRFYTKQSALHERDRVLRQQQRSADH